MRTDALMINLPGGDQTHKRMDWPKQSTDLSSPGFAMHSTGKKMISFNEAYNNVARSNHQAGISVPAFKKSGDSGESLQLPAGLLPGPGFPIIEPGKAETPQTGQENGSPDVESVMEQFCRPEAADRDSVRLQQEKSGQAAQIIGNALQRIADILQMNIMPGLDKLSPESVTGENAGQFAEIVTVLEKITEVLETTIRDGLPLDTGRTVLDVQSASEAVDILRAELFKIELGLNRAGIGELVQVECSRRMNIPLTTGIPQASDPGGLSMPLEHVARIFGGLIEELSQGRHPSMLSFDSVSAETANESVKEISVAAFDSHTYRALLKIEKKEGVAFQNDGSGESPEKQKFSQEAGPAVFSEISGLQEETEKILLPAAGSVRGATGAETVSMDSRFAGLLTRATEEDLLRQLSGKMQHLVRSGGTEIRIQLRPESLGEVRLAIRMEGDVVAARILVENQQVKQIVESNLQSLRNALSEQNLQAGSFEVNVGSGGRQSDQFLQGWNQESLSAADAGDMSTDSVDGPDEERIAAGMDTGRRYGSNSFEYYA